MIPQGEHYERDRPLTPVRSAGRISADAAAILDALESAVIVMGADGTVTFANRAVERVTGVRPGDCVGYQLDFGLPALALLKGRARPDHIDVAGPLGMHRYAVVATRCGEGTCLELRYTGDRDAASALAAEKGRENDFVRELARRMSKVSDSASLLQLLCDSAQAQCKADGAAVAMIRGDWGEVVGASGRTARARGCSFPLEGSLTARVIETRTSVSLADYGEEFPGVVRRIPALDAGPVIITPLIAHDTVLGVLSTTRPPGSDRFSAREEEWQRVIADFASLVLWTTHLFEQAQSAVQARNAFLTTVSHELRTPLTALTGFGELLADEYTGPLNDTQRDMVERICAATHNMADMIDEILTYSSLEAGREVARLRVADPAEIVEAATAEFANPASQKGIALEVSIPADVGTVHTDADKVRQILAHLVGNAVKFTKRGSVRVEVSRPNGTMRFSVSDTGIGIDPSNVDRLFQPFVQLDAGLTRQHGGTGLGLYISRRLATLIGGRIDVASEPGFGSVFTLVLPQRHDESAAE